MAHSASNWADISFLLDREVISTDILPHEASGEVLAFRRTEACWAGAPPECCFWVRDAGFSPPSLPGQEARWCGLLTPRTNRPLLTLYFSLDVIESQVAEWEDTLEIIRFSLQLLQRGHSLGLAFSLSPARGPEDSCSLSQTVRESGRARAPVSSLQHQSVSSGL